MEAGTRWTVPLWRRCGVGRTNEAVRVSQELLVPRIARRPAGELGFWTLGQGPDGAEGGGESAEGVVIRDEARRGNEAGFVGGARGISQVSFSGGKSGGLRLSDLISTISQHSTDDAR